MSSHVVGFRAPDEQWAKMKAAWDACEAVGITPPDEVLNFFDGEDPGDKPGKEVTLGDAIREWTNEYASGYEVDLVTIPNGLRYLRFYNSW